MDQHPERMEFALWEDQDFHTVAHGTNVEGVHL